MIEWGRDADAAMIDTASEYCFDQERGNRSVHQAIHRTRIYPVPALGSR